MKVVKLMLAMVLAGGLAFTGCRNVDETEDLANVVENGDNHDDPEDYLWDESDVVPIVFDGTSISALGEGVSISGSVVTINSSGNYSLSGTLTDGQLIVNSEDEGIVRLILNGVDMSCSSSAPIYIINAKKTIIYLAENSSNFMEDGDEYVFEDPDEDFNAAVYSKDDLTIFGEGTLTVKANYKDGITSKDGFIIASGTIMVDAEDDGIRGKDYLIIKNGTFVIEAEGDGLKSDNDEDGAFGYVDIEDGAFDIASDRDAISAETDVLITNGSFNLVSGGGSSNSAGDNSEKGIKAGFLLQIDNGIFDINTADDALHSNGLLTINGGDFLVATGDDGFHADSDLEVNAGTIDITKSYEGLESADGNITINGGTIHAVTSDDGINVAAGGAPSGGGPGGAPMVASAESGQYLYINGGYIYLDASGDGLDSNGSIDFTAGTAIVNGPTLNNNGPIDCDGTFNMNGGFMIAAGSSGMAESPSSSSGQYGVMLTFGSSQLAGTLVHIQINGGDEILSFQPTKTFQSMVFSTSSLASGTTYDVYLNGSSSGSAVDGLYEGGSYTPGTKATTYTISNKITQVNL